MAGAPGALPLATLLALGCASGGGAAREAAEAPPGAITFIVENTESPGQGLSVTLEAANGNRALLGAVGPRRTETFVVEEPPPTTSYRLEAGLTGGRNVTSERFTVDPGSTVRWMLPNNQVTVTPP